MSPNDKKYQNTNEINACNTNADSNLPNKTSQPASVQMFKSNIKKHSKRAAIITTAAIIFTLTVTALGILQAAHVINLGGIFNLGSQSNTSGTPKHKLAGGAGGLNNDYTSSQSSSSELEKLKSQETYVTDKVSSSITFPSGGINTSGQWVCGNPEQNKVIMQAQIYLGNKLIAKSEGILPGRHIESIKLLSDVQPGNYKATAFIMYYDQSSRVYIGKSGYKLSLTVS